MKLKELYYDLLLLLVALIWGITFSMQKEATAYLSAFQFNFARFAIGSVAMLSITILSRQIKHLFDRQMIRQSLLLGLLLFLSNSSQQFGIEFTSVANSGFITTLYVIIVPILMFLMGRKVTLTNWIAASLAVIGLYLISSGGTITAQFGDLMQLVCAFLWALHIIYISFIVKSHNVLCLNFLQLTICSFLSLITSLLIDNSWDIPSFTASWELWVLSGLMSTAVAFSLQLFAQKHVNPNLAAIIFSLEGVFAAVFGWILLGEMIGGKAWIGGLIITFAAIYAQLKARRNND